MGQNLVEFLKVLTIVVTWSTGILAMRRYMLSIDTSRDEVKDEHRVDDLKSAQNPDGLKSRQDKHAA